MIISTFSLIIMPYPITVINNPKKPFRRVCGCVCSCPCYLVGTRIHSSWIGALVGLTRGDFFAGASMTEVHKFMLLLLLLDDAFGLFTEKYFVLAGLSFLSIFTVHFRCEQLSKAGWQRSPWPQPLPLRDTGGFLKVLATFQFHTHRPHICLGTSAMFFTSPSSLRGILTSFLMQ